MSTSYTHLYNMCTLFKLRNVVVGDTFSSQLVGDTRIASKIYKGDLFSHKMPEDVFFSIA